MLFKLIISSSISVCELVLNNDWIYLQRCGV